MLFINSLDTIEHVGEIVKVISSLSKGYMVEFYRPCGPIITQIRINLDVIWIKNVFCMCTNISHDMKKNSMLDEMGIYPFCHSQMDCMSGRGAT